MDATLARGASREMHARHVAGETLSRESVKKWVLPMLERLISGRRLSISDLESIDNLMEEIKGTSLVLASILLKGEKSREMSAIIALPMSSGGEQFYGIYSVINMADRRRLIYGCRSVPIKISRHVAERFSVRTMKHPDDFFRDKLNAQIALSIALSYLLADKREKKGAIPIALPHGDGLILGVLRGASINPIGNSAIKFQSGLFRSSPYSLGEDRDVCAEWLTFVDGDATFEAQDVLSATLRKYIADYGSGLVGLVFEMFMNIENLLLPPEVLPPEVDAALVALQGIVDGPEWRRAVRMPKEGAR